MIVKPSHPYTLASHTNCQDTDQNLPKSMAAQTRRDKKRPAWYSACGFTPFGREKSSAVFECLWLVNKSRCNLIGNHLVIPHDTIPSNVSNQLRKQH
jgi:hypothetical protein